MNERIKQLLGQAYDEAVPETWTTLSSEQLGRIHEKFAELIVRECIQVIDDATPVYSPEDRQEDYCQGTLNGYHSALLEIKQHFGIEE